MRVGIHDKLFVKNVCAIGMSAGFIEPLESNGLLTVHEFLVKLVKILNRPVISNFVKQQFNMSCKRFFHEFAEFVAAHYAKERILQLDIREKEWKDKVSVCPSLYEFLKKKYI